MALLRSEEAVSQISARSSVYANGFAKIVLHASDHYNVRLHIWHRRNGRWVPDVDPHGPRWEFASWIVAGTLRETTFVESAAGLRYERFAYSSGPQGTFLAPDGWARLRPATVIERQRGVVYTRSRQMTHTTTPHGDSLVASLVLHSSRRFDPTPVYMRPNVERDHSNWPISPSDLRSIMSEVAAEI
jgi:hypothetical protein